MCLFNPIFTLSLKSFKLFYNMHFECLAVANFLGLTMCLPREMHSENSRSINYFLCTLSIHLSYIFTHENTTLVKFINRTLILFRSIHQHTTLGTECIDVCSLSVQRFINTTLPECHQYKTLGSRVHETF